MKPRETALEPAVGRFDPSLINDVNNDERVRYIKHIMETSDPSEFRDGFEPYTWQQESIAMAPRGSEGIFPRLLPAPFLRQLDYSSKPL